MKNKKDLLSINETAKMLGICSQTLRNWEKRDDFPLNIHYTLGGHRRYSRKEVVAFLEDVSKKGGQLNEQREDIENHKGK